MIDTNLIKADSALVADSLSSKKYKLDLKIFEDLEVNRKAAQIQTEALQAKRNALSKEYGLLKKEGKDDTTLNQQIAEVKSELDSCSKTLTDIQSSLQAFLLDIPNLPASSVPHGAGEKDNIKIRDFGKPLVFGGKDHLDITSLINMDAANILAGSRFSVLTGKVAKLQRALISFMLDKAEEHGYEEHYLPLIANTESLQATGQLPKFADDLFQLTDDYYLIPTAEVPLTNLYRDQIISLDSLPIKLTAHTSCFRSEAGSYGKDTRGLIRQHQFEKVELVQICHPDHSFEALESLTKNAETILQELNLPYQVIELCTGDLGFSAAKTYDLEVWIPSQESFREISSCSNCTDFQARRAKIRFKQDGTTQFAHTLNGSALAAGRTLIAIIENCYDQKSLITIPEALQDYTKFKTIEV
ncbi:serine--tRNA ligase [Gammaproteobacteria bacterium]|nr:serine--tRNA ligase [Gammaproteobacteria bacterium]MDB3902092.1 serine--tRNA ligase [bacterium]MDB9838037.1 serine--tRNA ligase [Gammaproteobacteria bacterium]MDB9855040.1 serine--tRNA ligase [Gammaproteobacteria bacterium]MDC1009318.1 serine--tRNA ligase [Gammaproteobacteria bacterium]